MAVIGPVPYQDDKGLLPRLEIPFGKTKQKPSFQHVFIDWDAIGLANGAVAGDTVTVEIDLRRGLDPLDVVNSVWGFSNALETALPKGALMTWPDTGWSYRLGFLSFLPTIRLQSHFNFPVYSASHKCTVTLRDWDVAQNQSDIFFLNFYTPTIICPIS